VAGAMIAAALRLSGSTGFARGRRIARVEGIAGEESPDSAGRDGG